MSPYRVQSPVSLSIFREFLSALEGESLNITETNFPELKRLCEEFSFSELSSKLSEFRSSTTFSEAEDADARGRIAALEEKANQHDYLISILQDRVTQLSTNFERLVVEVSALRSASTGIQTLSAELSALKTQIAANSLTAAPSPPSPQRLSVPSFDSRIVSDFPEIFAEFRKKRFKILWRGSRDGFKVKEFHRRCDGHANTLTVILDTKGNIFGGFTPVKWESSGDYKADDSMRSFVFTLKNPHNFPARRFALKADKKFEAIYCDSRWGPFFCDITVADNCDANTESDAPLGNVYVNDTGLEGKIVFTDSMNFQVKEIEVFEITA